MYSMSPTYKSKNMRKTLWYGLGKIDAFEVTDSVALTNSKFTYAKGLDFLSVFKASNMDFLIPDGVVGLGARKKVKESNKDDKHMFIYQLWQQKVIPYPVFAIYLGDESQQSKIRLGSYDKEIVKKCFDDNWSDKKNTNDADGIFWLEI